MQSKAKKFCSIVVKFCEILAKLILVLHTRQKLFPSWTPEQTKYSVINKNFIINRNYIINRNSVNIRNSVINRNLQQRKITCHVSAKISRERAVGFKWTENPFAYFVDIVSMRLIKSLNLHTIPPDWQCLIHSQLTCIIYIWIFTYFINAQYLPFITIKLNQYWTS